MNKQIPAVVFTLLLLTGKAVSTAHAVDLEEEYQKFQEQVKLSKQLTSEKALQRKSDQESASRRYAWGLKIVPQLETMGFECKMNDGELKAACRLVQRLNDREFVYRLMSRMQADGTWDLRLAVSDTHAPWWQSGLVKIGWNARVEDMTIQGATSYPSADEKVLPATTFEPAQLVAYLEQFVFNGSFRIERLLGEPQLKHLHPYAMEYYGSKLKTVNEALWEKGFQLSAPTEVKPGRLFNVWVAPIENGQLMIKTFFSTPHAVAVQFWASLGDAGPLRTVVYKSIAEFQSTGLKDIEKLFPNAHRGPRFAATPAQVEPQALRD